MVVIIGTARVVCGAGFMKRHGVRPSVPAWVHTSKPAAAGLLLWARTCSSGISCCGAARAWDIDQLLRQRRANAGSGTLSAYVGCWLLCTDLLSLLLWRLVVQWTKKRRRQSAVSASKQVRRSSDTGPKRTLTASSSLVSSQRRRHAGAEQRLPCGCVRSGRRRQELAGSALRPRHVPRHVRPDHRGHLPTGHQLQQTGPSLLECSNLNTIRRRFFGASSLKDLFDNIDNHVIIDFIKETHFYALV